MSHELCCNIESGFVGCSFVNFLNAKISDQWSVLLNTGYNPGQNYLRKCFH